MLKPNKLCNVCTAAEANPKLLKDIYNSKFFTKGSSVSLKDIYEDYQAVNGAQFSYQALLNHCKKHQFMSEKDFNSRHLRQIANDAERQILKHNIEAAQVWDQVIGAGTEKLANGEMIIKAGDLLKAAKDKSDFELKTKDQEMAFAEMMYFFASGENQTNLRKPYDRRHVEGTTVEADHLTAGIAADSGTGEDGPGAVYYPPSWDAVTSGPSEVPAGNDA